MTETVLIVRPKDHGQDTADILLEKGVNSIICPVIDYPALDFEHPSFKDYDGLVFTSRRAVRLFTEQVQERTLPVFTVGNGTASAAQAAGFGVINAATGNGESLCTMLEKKKRKHYLHIGGKLRSSGTETLFKNPLFTMDSVVIYDAHPLETLPDETVRPLQEKKITKIMFFSLRSAENFVRLIRKHDLVMACTSVTACCMSQKIADSVSDSLDWHSIDLAAAPNHDAMINLITE